MDLPLNLIVAILEMAWENLDYMLMNASLDCYRDQALIKHVYSEWRAVDEVLYELRPVAGVQQR